MQRFTRQRGLAWNYILGPTAALEEAYRQAWLADARTLGASPAEIDAVLLPIQEDRCAPLESQLHWLREIGSETPIAGLKKAASPSTARENRPKYVHSRVIAILMSVDKNQMLVLALIKAPTIITVIIGILINNAQHNRLRERFSALKMRFVSFENKLDSGFARLEAQLH